MLLKRLKEVVEGYFALLIEHLLGLFSTAPSKVKAVATGAIARVARLPPSVARTPDKLRLRHFHILSREGEDMDLRGTVMCAAGTVAEAIGKEAFRLCLADALCRLLGRGCRVFALSTITVRTSRRFCYGGVMLNAGILFNGVQSPT